MWPSTCSKKVRICLAEKGLDWDSRVIRTDGVKEHLEPWYVALNPNGVVPTLDHDGNIIIESCVILEYLEDVFPDTRLRPEDPVATAHMRYWLDRSESILHKCINVLSQNRFNASVLAGLSHQEKLELAARQPRIATRAERLHRYEHGISVEEEQLAEETIAECLDDMEKLLSGQPWLAGDEYSLADIAMVPFFERFEANGLSALADWNRRPAVGDWYRRIGERPAYETGMALDKVR
jgi:glutathione S-transferase